MFKENIPSGEKKKDFGKSLLEKHQLWTNIISESNLDPDIKRQIIEKLNAFIKKILEESKESDFSRMDFFESRYDFLNQVINILEYNKVRDKNTDESAVLDSLSDDINEFGKQIKNPWE